MRKPLFLSLSLVLIFCTGNLYAWRIEKNVLIIEKGDNLWEIAHALHARGFDYPKLWKGKLDKGLTNDPSLIYDGMRFQLEPLPQQDGTPINPPVPEPDAGKQDTHAPNPTGSSTVQPASVNNVVNNYGEKSGKENEEPSSWKEWGLKLLEDFITIVILPLIVLRITRWITRNDEIEKRKFYSKWILAALAVFLLHGILGNFRLGNSSVPIPANSAVAGSGPGNGFLWWVAVLILLLVLGLLVWRFFMNADAKNKIADRYNNTQYGGDDAAYFEVAGMYKELKEMITQLKAVSGKEADENSKTHVAYRAIVTRIQSWIMFKGALYLRPYRMDNLNSRLDDLLNKLSLNIYLGPEDTTLKKIEKEITDQVKIIAQSFKENRSTAN